LRGGLIFKLLKWRFMWYEFWGVFLFVPLSFRGPPRILCCSLFASLGGTFFPAFGCRYDASHYYIILSPMVCETRRPKMTSDSLLSVIGVFCPSNAPLSFPRYRPFCPYAGYSEWSLTALRFLSFRSAAQFPFHPLNYQKSNFMTDAYCPQPDPDCN